MADAGLTQNPFEESEFNIYEYLRVFIEKKWIIISCIIIFFTITLIRVFMLAPVYAATTRVLIQQEAPQVVKVEDIIQRRAGEMNYYPTQYKILQSRAIAERVYAALDGYEPWDKWKGREEKSGKSRSTGNDEGKISNLLSRIKIEPIRGTNLVEIIAEDVNPELAAKISNQWAASYIGYILEDKADITQYASGWLKEQIDSAKLDVQGAEQNLQDYRRENKAIIDSLEKNVTALQSLQSKKTELEIRLSESLEYYKGKHPKMIALNTEIASVEDNLAIEKEKELKTKDKEIQYNMLKRDVESAREMYESLLTRIRETELTGAIKTTNVKIVDKATVPKRPVKPQKKKEVLIAVFFGFFVGTGIAFLFESLDQTVKNPDDVKKAIKQPVLASISLHGEVKENPGLTTHTDPRSVIAEAYRGLRTSIMFTAVEHRRKVLLFTSSGPQEGKTTTTTNTAIAMAQSGERTIIIDADLRHPRQDQTFKIDRKQNKGLTELLVGSAEMDEVIHHTEIPRLDVIICGAIPPNPSELLGSRKMDEVLLKLGEKYDRIIIDTPPVLAVTDAVVLSGKVDGTILVVKASHTNKNALIHTRELISSVKSSQLLGIVMNMVETTKKSGYYYYYSYYGKYGKYGEEPTESTEEKAKQKQIA